MNDTDRKTLAALRARAAEIAIMIESLHEDAQALADEVQGKFDNMPEGLRTSDRGEAAEAAANNLAEFAAQIESSKDALEDAGNMDIEE